MARWRRRMNRVALMRREEEWIERCESKESVNLMALPPPPSQLFTTTITDSLNIFQAMLFFARHDHEKSNSLSSLSSSSSHSGGSI